MANYKHGQKFNVAFYGSLPRTQVITNDPITGAPLPTPIQRPYFRLNFSLDNEEFSVRCDKDMAGTAGTVMFVEKGKLAPGTNQPIVQNAFSLVSLTNPEIMKAAKAAQEAIADFKW